ncbi:hypothetical protein [Cupriavidus sp. D384]|uniref:hypothetical protein n=1 Tax=Cupriavidus sp. D384 TaxID=1538095 RepID=UPI0008322F72|nr:hypothetical protein [Cupriavidus sp. D384]
METNDDSISADFMSALKRLIEGTPTNPKVKLKAANGKLRVNVLNVSLEAGHSRSLVGLANCAYPKVREAILEAMDDPTGPREALKAHIRRLRNLNSELEDMLAERDSYNALLLLRLRAYEQGNDMAGRRRKPATSEERKMAMSIVKAPKQKGEE